MKSSLCIVANNIHSGGGQVVLESFIMSELKNYESIVCHVNENINWNIELPQNVKIINCKSDLFSRLKKEWEIFKSSKNFTDIYFLGNLPPIFKNKSHTYLYFHNKLLIDASMAKFSTKQRIGFYIQKLWLNCFLKNVNTVLVQSLLMKKDFLNKFPDKNTQVKAYLPFHDIVKVKKTPAQKIKNSLIYVGSDLPHKNLKLLLKCISQLKSQGIEIYFHATLSPECQSLEPDLLKSVDDFIHSKERLELLTLVQNSEFLVFPSLNESFGLPLWEAKQLGTKVIAADLDYVHEIIEPDFVFDPLDSQDMERVIKTALQS